MTVVTENQWLDYFGFERFPFDRPEAGNEEFARPEFLASCFVKPGGFDEVFGDADNPVTSLLLAARGAGKTACRVMMDYHCRKGLAQVSSTKSDELNYVLSVPHVRLDNVREIARQVANSINPDITVEHHVIEIMFQSISSFVQLIAETPIFSDRIKKLSKADFEDLSFYILEYSMYLTSSQLEFLMDLGISMPPAENLMRGLAGQTHSRNRPVHVKPLLYQKRRSASPLFHLDRWAKLMMLIGLRSTYVLIDGVDELMESASDPNFAHSLIRPLLTHLPLMETPHLALKFFLPMDMESVVNSDTAIRWDRGIKRYKIKWRDEDMAQLIRERVGMLRRMDYEIRDRTAAGFDALCVPELKGKIENDLARSANGNPRYLMNLCAQMITSHCSKEVENQDDPFQLNREDYYCAVERVKVMYHSISSILDNQRTQEPKLPELLEQEPAVFQRGQIIDGKYEVRKLLPVGAAGQVYCVYDEVFERMCALKIYNNSSLSTDSFKTETHSLLKIDHPNIVKIYDWGILKQTRRFYLVSEFVEGDELTKYILLGNLLPLQKAIQSILELLFALEHLHPNTDRVNELRNKMQEGEIEQEEYEEFSKLKEEGLFHRDIKPSNIILSPTGVKLIDFNIAAKAITVGQTFAGTEGYMLPETGIMRWSADGDLFAAGIVFYELVTGCHPYPERQPVTDILPTNPLQYVPNLDPKLVEIMLRAVSCDSQIRYHSARQFKQDVIELRKYP